jgi:hypothetical protein
MQHNQFATDLPASAQSQGGKARAAALSPERRAEIAKAAAQARWGRQGPPAPPTSRDWLLVATKGRLRARVPQ